MDVDMMTSACSSWSEGPKVLLGLQNDGDKARFPENGRKRNKQIGGALFQNRKEYFEFDLFWAIAHHVYKSDRKIYF